MKKVSANTKKYVAPAAEIVAFKATMSMLTTSADLEDYYYDEDGNLKPKEDYDEEDI